jgi:hypothetical protein
MKRLSASGCVVLSVRVAVVLLHAAAASKPDRLGSASATAAGMAPLAGGIIDGRGGTSDRGSWIPLGSPIGLRHPV